jgi:hypothetical protein
MFMIIHTVIGPALSREPKWLEPQSTPLEELSFHLAWWNARSLQGGMTALRARPPSACSGEYSTGSMHLSTVSA